MEVGCAEIQVERALHVKLFVSLDDEEPVSPSSLLPQNDADAVIPDVPARCATVNW